MSWEELSAVVAENPNDFKSWEKLISSTEQINGGIVKASSDEDKELLRILYQNFLVQFPLCEQYWINYALWEFKLGETEKAKDIFRKSLTTLPRSLLIWVAYAKFMINVETNRDKLHNQVLEKGRRMIGLHFYSHLYYDVYLDYLKSEDYKRYVFLLRRILEIPLYHYSKYFKLWFKLIENSDMEGITLIINEDDLKSWGHMGLQDLKVKLRKTYIDLYITTQYHTFKLWNLEKRLTHSNYFSASPLKEIRRNDWVSYVLFAYTQSMANPHTKNQHLPYVNDQFFLTVIERCLIVTGTYQDFWLVYAAYYLRKNMVQQAKEQLLRGIYLNPILNVDLRIQLVDLYLITKEVQKAHSVIVELYSFLPNSYEVFLKYLTVERLAQIDFDLLKEFQDKLEAMQSTEYEAQFDYLFADILRYDIPVEKLPDLFEKYDTKSSLIYWKSYLSLNILYLKSLKKFEAIKTLALERVNPKLKDDLEEHIRGIFY
ncbi:hypothetical protein LJB42_001530 [Komagataella kurtzmanii]|nr:hypothetical protein LJB42_001530 [Komagataella kurtzmanii]